MAAKVVTVFNEKGGVGKTTTTCQLAGTLGIRGYDVLVADLDPSQASANWLGANEAGTFPATIWPGFRYGNAVVSELQRLSTKYDIIVADCAPSVDQPATWGALLVSDLALIPTRLSPPDISQLVTAKRLARRAMDEARRSIPTYVVATATRMHMADDQAWLALLSKDTEFPPAPVTLGERKAFSRPMVTGSTAHGERNGADAVREIEALADFVLSHVKLPKHRRK